MDSDSSASSYLVWIIFVDIWGCGCSVPFRQCPRPGYRQYWVSSSARGMDLYYFSFSIWYLTIGYIDRLCIKRSICVRPGRSWLAGCDLARRIILIGIITPSDVQKKYVLATRLNLQMIEVLEIRMIFRIFELLGPGYLLWLGRYSHFRKISRKCIQTTFLLQLTLFLVLY